MIELSSSIRLEKFYRYDLSATPETSFWFGLFPFRSPLLGKSNFFLFLWVLRCFSSPGVPPYTYVFSIWYLVFTRWVSPFGNLHITGYVHLHAAYRSLSRPSSAPSARAFTVRPL